MHEKIGRTSISMKACSLLVDFDSIDLSVENSKKELLALCVKNGYDFYEEDQIENYIIRFKIKEDKKTYYFKALINKIECYVEFNISQTGEFYVFDEELVRRYISDHHRESFYLNSGEMSTSVKQFTYGIELNENCIEYIIEWLIEKNNDVCDDVEGFLSFLTNEKGI